MARGCINVTPLTGKAYSTNLYKVGGLGVSRLIKCHYVKFEVVKLL